MTVAPISYSSLSKFETCARNWQAVYMHKMEDAGSKAKFAGTVEHEAIEKAVTEGTPAPDSYSHGIIKTLREAGGRIEVEKWLTINREGVYAPYGTPTWLRAKVDLMWTSDNANRVTVLDWKTGKWAPRNAAEVDYTQLRFYALCALGIKRKADTVTSALVYTQHSKMFPITFHRKDTVGATQTPEFKLLRERIAVMEMTAAKPNPKATPGRACTYCPDVGCPHNPGYDG